MAREREIEKMYSYFNFVFYITMQKHELLFWSKNIIKNILKPTVGLSKLIWSQVKYVLFVSKISRYICVEHTYRLDNTFKFFFIYRCVVFEKQFWKFILKKKQQQNKQTSKTKKKNLFIFWYQIFELLI